MSEPQPEISYEDFERVDVRVGRIVAAEPNAGARKPSYRLRIDFGPDLGVKQSSAQLTEHYTPEALVGTLVIAVVNFTPRRINGYRSDVLTLGLPDADGAVVLLRPDHEVPLGGKLF